MGKTGFGPDKPCLRMGVAAKHADRNMPASAPRIESGIQACSIANPVVFLKPSRRLLDRAANPRYPTTSQQRRAQSTVNRRGAGR
jgi:hypothetical protein